MFGPFERMVAFRYLRARKGERFVDALVATRAYADPRHAPRA